MARRFLVPTLLIVFSACAHQSHLRPGSASRQDAGCTRLARDTIEYGQVEGMKTGRDSLVAACKASPPSVRVF